MKWGTRIANAVFLLAPPQNIISQNRLFEVRVDDWLGEETRPKVKSLSVPQYNNQTKRTERVKS